jgi:hypothetical protein
VKVLIDVALQDNQLKYFKQVLRDFLLALQEFSSEDNAELFLEETEAQRQAELDEKLKIMGGGG